jgi:CYTH domain-containing protein
MAHEIERKFLVTGTSWKNGAHGVHYRQGYLSTAKERTVRVRTDCTRGVVTIKGLTHGITRLEFEYEIPLDDARQLLDLLCERPLIEKTRYHLDAGRHTWTIDEFHGDNKGLIVAEVELESASQPFAEPAWLGAEVSNDPRYFNANLIKHPYTTWSEAARREDE